MKMTNTLFFILFLTIAGSFLSVQARTKPPRKNNKTEQPLRKPFPEGAEEAETPQFDAILERRSAANHKIILDRMPGMIMKKPVNKNKLEPFELLEDYFSHKSEKKNNGNMLSPYKLIPDYFSDKYLAKNNKRKYNAAVVEEEPESNQNSSKERSADLFNNNHLGRRSFDNSPSEYNRKKSANLKNISAKIEHSEISQRGPTIAGDGNYDGDDDQSEDGKELDSNEVNSKYPEVNTESVNKDHFNAQVNDRNLALNKSSNSFKNNKILKSAQPASNKAGKRNNSYKSLLIDEVSGSELLEQGVGRHSEHSSTYEESEGENNNNKSNKKKNKNTARI